jgi:hypothetical protein
MKFMDILNPQQSAKALSRIASLIDSKLGLLVEDFRSKEKASAAVKGIIEELPSEMTVAGAQTFFEVILLCLVSSKSAQEYQFLEHSLQRAVHDLHCISPEKSD